MMAAGWGRADIMRLLLEKGASIDAKDFHGNTALLLLASGSAAPTAGATALLLSRGANREVRNNDGAYPLDSLRFETGIR
jgi:ankyrin repeat protein